MEQQCELNPLSELAQAIREIDFKMDEIERLEKMLSAERMKLVAAKDIARKTYGPACTEAQNLGCEIPSSYHFGDTLIRFDDESHEVNVERTKIGSTFELTRLVEKTPEAS